MSSCGTVHEIIITQLLSAGADVHARNLKQATPLHEAVRNSNLSAMALLVSAGSDVLAVDENGNNVLHMVELVEALEILLKAGAEELVNSLNAAGATALHSAVQRQNYDVIDLLLQSGARVWIEDAQHRTAVDMVDTFDKLFMSDSEVLLFALTRQVIVIVTS